MSRVRVESAVNIKDMSRVRVESRWSSFESELSQLHTAWVKVESLIFRRENVKILQLSVTLQKKNQPTATSDRTPPPGQQLFPKLSKMWWVVSQIWLHSDSNELSQSWVRLVNLGFELSLSWVRLANLGFELSRSWVTWIVIWVRVESARKKMSRAQPCYSGHFVTWSELDLRSNFKTDLSGSNYILCFESSHQDKHNVVHIIFLHLWLRKNNSWKNICKETEFWPSIA